MHYMRVESETELQEQLLRGDCRVASGMTDMYPSGQMPSRGGTVVDISGVASLRGIEKKDEGWWIGSGTRWTDVLRFPWPPGAALLQEVASQVGAVQVQNAGTVGGNLCNASPAADGVPALLALGATVEVASASGSRSMALADFITGVRQTALAEGEYLRGIAFPDPPTNSTSAFVKLGLRKYLVISIVMAAGVVTRDADGRVASIALSLGACSPTAVRLPALEASLLGKPLDSHLVNRIEDKHIQTLIKPIGDVRATAAYRAEAAVQVLRDTVANMIERMA